MPSEIKPLGGLERVRLADAVPLDTPFTLYLFPNMSCNFRCIYCAHSQSREELKEQYDICFDSISMETVQKLVEQLKGFPRKLKVISLTGHGEPLLHRKIPEMIRLIKQAGVCERIEIISNAALLTPELSDALLEAGLDILRVSIQGLNAAKYKEVCGYKLDFDRFIDNLQYFYQHRGNSQLFVKIIDVALEKGEESKFYNMFRNISDRMYVEYCQKVYSGVDLTKNRKAFSSNRYGEDFPPQQVCPLSFFMLGVRPDGDVIPCDTIYKPVILGNVNQDNIVDMWNGGKLRSFRINQLQNGRSTNLECARCVTPDDVLKPEDILDNDRENILARMQSQK